MFAQNMAISIVDIFFCNAVIIGTDNSAQLYNLVNQNIYSISRKHVFLEYNFYLRL